MYSSPANSLSCPLLYLMRAARGAMKQANTKILFKAGDRTQDGQCLGVSGNCSFRKATDARKSILSAAR
jgi:hypothetical protein